jgi:hypothetical protein
MTIGETYQVKHGYSNPYVLLAVGGYRPRIDQEGRTSRIGAQPSLTTSDRFGRSKPLSLNLMLRVDKSIDVPAYTEADFLAGKPVPEGCWVTTVSSGDIEMTWADYLPRMIAAREHADMKARQDDLRKNVTLPKVKAELDRLGMTKYLGDYSTKIELSLTEFLALAARIETKP